MKQIALEAGREALSSETGFIHRGDTIPIFENLCFALSLFRARAAEEVQAGKKLLERLIPFQTETGAFPHSLHDYPTPSTAPYRLLCALPLHWIYKDYQQVIEPPLKEKLEESLAQLLKISDEGLASPYRALLCAFQGKEMTPFGVSSSYEWGILLLAYQLQAEKSHWILEGALQNWHPELMTYCGQPLQEHHRQSQPETTLYDLFMATYHGFIPERLKRIYPLHLQAALVFPFERQLSSVKHELLPASSPRVTNGFHHMRLLWGCSEKIYSLVAQDTALQYLKKEGSHIFTLPETIPDEKDRMELSLYCSYLSDVSLTIDGEDGTLFQLGQTVEIHTPEKKLQLKFNLQEGEGKFVGRISRGNRPAQVGLSGPQDFTSYDWKISLRTLKRSPDCKIQLSVL